MRTLARVVRPRLMRRTAIATSAGWQAPTPSARPGALTGPCGRSGAAGRFAARRARKETRPTPFSQPRGAAEKRYSTPSNEFDWENVEEAQDLASRLADSMFGHARNEHRAPGLYRDLAALEAHQAGAGEDIVDFRRRVPVQAQPLAGLKLGHATGHAVRWGHPFGHEGAPPKPTAHRIVPAILRRVRLVERERRDLIRNGVHRLSQTQPDAPPLADRSSVPEHRLDSGLVTDERSDPSSEVGSINAD